VAGTHAQTEKQTNSTNSSSKALCRGQLASGSDARRPPSCIGISDAAAVQTFEHAYQIGAHRFDHSLLFIPELAATRAPWASEHFQFALRNPPRPRTPSDLTMPKLAGCMLALLAACLGKRRFRLSPRRQIGAGPTGKRILCFSFCPTVRSIHELLCSNKKGECFGNTNSWIK
jgi:hypothetical protein